MKFRGVNDYLVCPAPPECVCVCERERLLLLKGYTMLKHLGELL